MPKMVAGDTEKLRLSPWGWEATRAGRSRVPATAFSATERFWGKMTGGRATCATLIVMA